MNKESIINNIIGGLILAVIIGIATVIYEFYSSLSNAQWLLLSLIIILLIIFLYYRYKFQVVTGIRAIDRTMKDGITPKQSLKLCKNNIKFLGIAAYKLIDNDEFEKAIQRCHRPTNPIKFLLSHPENPILKHAATRANKHINEFKKKVEYSLEKLSDLKNKHGYNIEVRLYKSNESIHSPDSGPPSFRLFFIDESSVLVSYYIFGEGEGLQMPQVRINKPKKGRDVKNFYYPFEHYFSSLWDTSDIYPL